MNGEWQLCKALARTVAEMAQGHADMPQLSEEAIKKAHTAKKYIENLYRMQEKNLRERNER